MKIVFCDLDGTILMPGEDRLSGAAYEGVEKILQNNIIFCVASGRSYSELKRIMKDFDDKVYFIPSDGSQIIYKEETLFAKSLDKSSMNYLDEERDYVLHGKYLSYVKSCKDTFVRKIKEQYNGHIVRVANYKEIDRDVYKLTLYNSDREIPLDNVYKDYMIREFVNDTNKGYAVKRLMEILHLDKKDSIALGDGVNDIEMFQAAGESYAMIQAPPHVKKQATGTVINFSRFIEKVIKE
ncbi:MAG: HAD family phosphatase [Ruminococcaceae bacterium]|nr:HAD family phosphatase [Oscillospiraceae bacterium]